VQHPSKNCQGRPEQKIRLEYCVSIRDSFSHVIYNIVDIEMWSTFLLEKIENELDKIVASKEHQRIILNVHPFIAAYLKKGLPSIQFRWLTKYKKWIKILPRDAYQYLNFEFTDSVGELLK